MPDERYNELMQGALDGTLSDGEQAEFQRYLASHEEARRYYEELRASVRLVSSLPSIRPPAALKSAILEAVRAAARKSPPRPSLREWMVRTLESKVAFNYVYALSAGIVIGVALYALIAQLDRQSPASSDVSGALLPKPAGAEFQPVETMPIDTLGIVGMLQARQANSSYLVEMRFTSGTVVQTTVEFDGQALCLSGFSQTKPTPETVSIHHDRLSLTTDGENSVILLFESRSSGGVPSPIRVTLSSPEGTVQRALVISRQP